MKRLENRVAIITGGAKGIGKETARRFLEEGARVIIWDVDEDAAGSTLAEFEKSHPDHCSYMHVNTADSQVVERSAARVHKDFGQIDILINNAGITRDATLKKMTDEQWNQVLSVNLTGVFNCGRAVAKYMSERGYGRIVNACSVVALYGNFGQTNYAATKAGVVGMTRVWARELGRKGVTVNAVAPGFIATRMLETVPEKVLDMLKGRTPLGRLGEPVEVANTYLFLSGDEASFINGAVISVDGGITI